MKNLKVVFLVTIFFSFSCNDAEHSKSKNDAQSYEIFQNLDKEVKMKIDSFILKDTNHIYALYINRTSNNTNLFVFIVQHIDYLKYYGLPFFAFAGVLHLQRQMSKKLLTKQNTNTIEEELRYK